MTSAPAIGFEYRPSHWLRRAVVATAILAALAIVLCALAFWLKVLLLAIVLLATAQHVWTSARPLVAAAGWGADNSWTLRLADHEDVPARLASFRVLGGWVLLRLCAAQRGTHVLLLAPDNSDADIRRRLRMRLATVQQEEAVPRI
jgi:toxin CptA